MLHVAVCAYVPSLTHSSLQQKQGLPLLNQVISWTTLGQWTSVNALGCLCGEHLKNFPMRYRNHIQIISVQTTSCYAHLILLRRK